MSWLLPIFMVLFATPAASPSQLAIFNNLPMTEIVLDIPAEENEQEVRRLVGFTEGETFSRLKVRQAVKRLYGTGRYEYIDINAGRNGQAVRITVTIRLKHYIDDISFINLNDLDEKALRAAIVYKEGDEISQDTYEYIRHQCVNYLQKRGYYEAETEVTELSRVNNHISLGVTIHANQPTTIASLHLSRQPAIKEEALIRHLDSQPGRILDTDILAKDLETLLKNYRSHGFLEAEIAEPQIIRENNQARVVIPVTAGHRIRFAFSGNHILSDNYLASLLTIPENEVFNRLLLETYKNIIRHNYIERGYYQVKVDYAVQEDPETLDKTYLFEINEGSYLPVGELVFNGNNDLDTKLLRAELFAKMRELHKSPLFGQLLDTDDLQQLQGPASGRNSTSSLDDGYIQLSKHSFSSIDPTRVYIPELYHQALEHLQALYHLNGFLKVKLSQREVTIDEQNKQLSVTIDIQEGPQTIINNVRVSGITSEEIQELGEALSLRSGIPLSETALDKNRQAIIDHYKAAGHYYAGVQYDTQITPDFRQANINVQITKGPKVRVGAIIIHGLNHIRSQVILSQMTLKSGDIFTDEQALRSRQFLISLGVFSTANIELVDPGRPASQKDLLVRVTERPRQNLGAGVGLSTEDGIRASLQYSHLNLFGIALGLSTSLKVNRQFFFSLYGAEGDQMARRYQHYKPFTEAMERQLLLSLNVPYVGFLPREISLTLSLLNERDNTLSYSLESSSAILGINYKPTRRVTVQLEQSIVYNALQCVTGDDCSNPRDDRGNIKRIDAGRYTMYKIIPRLKLDFRDNSFNPHKGLWTNISLEYSQGIGKPISFFKLEGQFSFYIPAAKRLTIALAVNMGQIFNLGSSFPISDSFYFGGRSSVRGYFERSIVPADACVKSPTGETIYSGGNCSDTLYAVEQSDGSYYVQTKGGRTYAVFRVEGRIQIYKQLSLGVFADLGNLVMSFPSLFTTRPRFGIGVGARYETPLGPLALDFGFNPFPRNIIGEGIFQLHFSIGLF